MEKIKAICPKCGAEFTKRTTNQKFCSKKCKTAFAGQKKRDTLAERGTDCPYNDGLYCTDAKCETCGWNPEIAKRRLAAL